MDAYIKWSRKQDPLAEQEISIAATLSGNLSCVLGIPRAMGNSNFSLPGKRPFHLDPRLVT